MFERYCVNRCSAWIAGGKTSTDILLSRGYGKRPHATLPLGVDTNYFSPQPSSREKIRRDLGWENSGAPVVGFLGRFVHEKGVEMLCQALDKTHQPFRVLFVGGGPMEKQLLEWGARYSSQVRVATGVQHNQVPDYLNAMDLICAPSLTTKRWREQFGRMIIEAFACGTPVIASNSGEIPYVVGDAGIVFDEANPSELTTALNTLLADHTARRTLAEKGLERAHRLFSWSKIAEGHLSFFSECLERPTE